MDSLLVCLHVMFLLLYFYCLIYCVYTGSLLWDNPRVVGTPVQDNDGQTSYEGPRIGFIYANLEEMKYLSFLKGGSAVFTVRFEGIDIPLHNHTM